MGWSLHTGCEILGFGLGRRGIGNGRVLELRAVVVEVEDEDEMFCGVIMRRSLENLPTAPLRCDWIADS